MTDGTSGRRRACRLGTSPLLPRRLHIPPEAFALRGIGDAGFQPFMEFVQARGALRLATGDDFRDRAEIGGELQRGRVDARLVDQARG